MRGSKRSCLYLAHHGIKGMKWGVRRFRNEDGSLTAQGKLRYKQNADGSYRKLTRAERRAAREAHTEAEISRYLKGDRDVSAWNGFLARSKVRGTERELRNEYDQSSAGKRARDKYRDAAKRYKDARDAERAYNEADADPFSFTNEFVRQMGRNYVESTRADANKAGAELSSKRGRYVSEALIKEYGEAAVERVLSDSLFFASRRNGESIVDWYIRNEKRNHTFEDEG